MSEASKGGVYQERLTLAQIYGVEFSWDASRIPALFCNQAQCKRAGNK
ncbi:MAG: hypothetical protein ACJAXJ_001591 [Colwellia sp.]|jgi:hypothetical protein